MDWGQLAGTEIGQAFQNSPLKNFWTGLLGSTQNQSPAFNDVQASQNAQPPAITPPQGYQSTPGLLNDPTAFNMMKSNSLPWMKQYMSNPYVGMQGTPATSSPGTSTPGTPGVGLLNNNWFSPQVPNFSQPTGVPNDITSSFTNMRTDFENQMAGWRGELAKAQSAAQAQAEALEWQRAMSMF